MAPQHSVSVKEEEREEWPREGSFVLAKLPPHPHWPAVVGPCSLPEWNNLWRRPYRGRTLYWVYFYNSYEGEWVSIEALVPFNDANIARLCLLRRSSVPWAGPTRGLAGAIDEARDRIRELNTGLGGGHDDDGWRPAKGAVVLARVEIHPPWPAIVVGMAESDGVCDTYKCRFLPLGAANWIPREEVSRYEYSRARATCVRPNNVQYEEYMKALEMADKLVADEQLDTTSTNKTPRSN